MQLHMMLVIPAQLFPIVLALPKDNLKLSFEQIPFLESGAKPQ